VPPPVIDDDSIEFDMDIIVGIYDSATIDWAVVNEALTSLTITGIKVPP
jgi:hypothetical protein